MADLAVFGDPVTDYLYALTDPIRTGGKMLGRYLGAVPGGTTANMACAAARLGVDVALHGRVAAGEESALHHAALAEAGVAAALTELPIPRGTHCVIGLDPGGEKTLIFVPMEAEPLHDALIVQAMSEARIAYVMAADFALLAKHATAGPLIAVDVDAAAGLTLDRFTAMRGGMDVIFINDVGFRKLTGAEPDAQGLRALMGERAQMILCTGGAGTTWLVPQRGEILTRQALPAQVIDTTGAGDCFNAAFLTRLLDSAPLPQALNFAMAAGALATETLGARASAPTRAAILNRMAK